MKINAYFGGLPGTGKTTCALGFPGVEQHVWGAGEEDTAVNFKGREDILPPKLFNWRDCLSDAEELEMINVATPDMKVTQLEDLAKFRNIGRYKKYIIALGRELREKKRDELKTVIVDNLSPFSDEFKSYILVKYATDIYTKDGNFDGRKFYPKFADELENMLRLILALPINVVVTSHIKLSIEEESAGKAMSKDASALPREWLPKIDGSMKYGMGGLFTLAFYLWVEDKPGLPPKYYAKALADDKQVGLAKARINIFDKPQKIEVPNQKFYELIVEKLKQKEG